MRTIRLALFFLVATFLAAPLAAQQPLLRELSTSDDGRGWEAVGRLNLGRHGFCTGALIEPQLVLTAAHCLFDTTTGQRIAPDQIEFLAGWRNGRAAAYRGVRRAVAHPAYDFATEAPMARVAHDLALLELDQPIRLPSIRPFEIDFEARAGDRVGVVSYARDRADAPSLQELCHVLMRERGVLVLSCEVDFGASGAPVFAMQYGTPRIVSVVSAMAELQADPVALGTSLREQLATLRQAMATGEMRVRRPGDAVGRAPDASAGTDVPDGAASSGIGAKFVRP